MTPIRYLTGDATDPQAAGPKIIAHCCNDLGRWGKGFVLAVSARWPEPEIDFKAWAKLGTAGGFALGAVRFVQVRADIVVANMIGQHGIKKGSNGPPIRYPAVATALVVVGDKAIELGASVHMPQIGSPRPRKTTSAAREIAGPSVVASGVAYVAARRLPFAERAAIVASVARVASGTRYGVTPSQIQNVFSVARCPACASASSSDSRSKSTDTKRSSAAADARMSKRARLYDCVDG